MFTVFLHGQIFYLPIGYKHMLYHSERGNLSKYYQLVHQGVQEDWLHRRDNMIFKGSVHGGISSEYCWVLPKHFGSERLLLGGSHRW